MKQYRALIARDAGDGEFVRTVEERTIDAMPAGDVLVRVHYSSLNYKDALSATGHRGVTRHYPHTPGIDAAGVVQKSTAEELQPGDEVIVTSYDLGMNTPGGWGQYIRVPSQWVVPLPDGLSLRESMIYGTAGFTAGLALLRLERAGLTPDRGDALVTGASGGLGSIAVGILARAGYRVVAATGKPEAEDYLRELGAAGVIAREAVLDDADRPLLQTRWAGAVDPVGGEYLASVLKATDYGGFVASCGLVASPDLATSVYPFILRGVSLIGIDSQSWPMDDRLEVWRRLAGDWKLETLDRLATEVRLEELEPEIERILKGQRQGRLVVALP